MKCDSALDPSDEGLNVAKQPVVEAYPIDHESEFAQEHAAIADCIEQIKIAHGSSYSVVELKSVPAGKKLLEAKPISARRFVVAAIEQAYFWNYVLAKVLVQCLTAVEKIDPDTSPDYVNACERRQAAATIVKTLTRKKLPFERSDLLLILKWCDADHEVFNAFWSPIGNLVRAMVRYAEANEIDPEFSAALKVFSEQLRTYYGKGLKSYAITVDQLIPEKAEPEEIQTAIKPIPRPSPAGTPTVLTRLKRFLGIPLADEPAETTRTGPDNFPLRADSPLTVEHHLLSLVIEEIIGTEDYYQPNLKKLKHGKQLLNTPEDRVASIFLAAAERQVNSLLTPDAAADGIIEWRSRSAATDMIKFVRTLGIPWSRSETFDAILFLSARRTESIEIGEQVLDQLIESAARYSQEDPLSEGERYALSLFRASLVPGPALGTVSDQVRQLNDLIDDGGSFCLAPGEAWSDLANQDYSQWKRDERTQWNTLFAHMLKATTSRPSKKWLSTAAEAIATIGEKKLVECLKRWLPEVTRGRTIRQLGYYSGDARGSADTMNDENATILRGLLWVIPTLKQRDQLTRLISTVTLSAYKKVTGVGPRAVKVGNAGVYALSELGSTDAVGQLAVLKVRVKFGTAQKEIEKAFAKTAEALGLPRDEIEEMGVPTYGLTEVGSLTESIADYEAQIEVTGSDAALHFRDAKGKTLKSVPTKIRTDHAEELKELRQALKDIKAMLPAQRDRIDSMFLAQRSWPLAAWRERYLDHPLVGTIARRLIWCVDDEPALFLEGTATAVDGSAIEHGATAEITLWHPVGRPVAEVVAWRKRLEQLQLTQPFKQAHREVYLLTAAEENTRTYSNRFAAHVLRQHQFNALCSARGWKNQLRLMVDADYAPPTKFLPQWNLRAEFWVEGIGDEYGTDTNESGSFLYLATDQVRFYRMEAAQNWVHASGGGYTTSAEGPGQ